MAYDALRPSGSRKAEMPFEIASSPVREEPPLARDRSTAKRGRRTACRRREPPGDDAGSGRADRAPRCMPGRHPELCAGSGDSRPPAGRGVCRARGHGGCGPCGAGGRSLPGRHLARRQRAHTGSPPAGRSGLIADALGVPFEEHARVRRHFLRGRVRRPVGGRTGRSISTSTGPARTTERRPHQLSSPSEERHRTPARCHECRAADGIGPLLARPAG